MKLREKQSLFVRLVAQLIQHATERGYELLTLSQVQNRLRQTILTITERSKTGIALHTQQATNSSRLVAVINTKSFAFCAREPANSAYAILYGENRGVALLSYPITSLVLVLTVVLPVVLSKFFRSILVLLRVSSVSAPLLFAKHFSCTLRLAPVTPSQGVAFLARAAKRWESFISDTEGSCRLNYTAQPAGF